ncbi:membrane protein insertase YidC [Streptomyces sp. 796.1]|uniref:membrane protein insertase YidC n=1 Tax=Streptomyces sp. 796.1 TaxID=3163029 RepID=UPI0039C98F8A
MDTILGPLYEVVSWIIVQFHSLYSLVFDKNSGWAWGLSIVSLVVLIRICLIPLFVKQIKATRNMQALQPRMKAIQERYKSDKQRQSEEMMKLYKETGTNPLSSCLPILAQSPFFIALYQVLNKIANNHPVGSINQDLVDSAREAHIFGAPLSVKFMSSASKVEGLGASLTDVRVVTITMIILMSASQFFTQRQLMTKNVDLTVKTPFMQQQKMLMYIFPIMFAVFGINFPVGVLVYWLTTNVWTMGQQMYIIRRNPTPGSLAYTKRQERLRAKGKLKEDPEVVEARQAVETARANRTQPKRQSKSQRQSGAAQGGTKTAGTAQGGAKDEPTDAKPGQASSTRGAGRARATAQAGGAKGSPAQSGKPSLEKGKKGAQSGKSTGSSASGSSRNAKSGQRKGQRGPKHPSKK